MLANANKCKYIPANTRKFKCKQMQADTREHKQHAVYPWTAFLLSKIVQNIHCFYEMRIDDLTLSLNV
jgi:hypothetical protein